MVSKISGASTTKIVEFSEDLEDRTIQKTKEIILRGIWVANTRGIDPQNPDLSILKAIYYAVSYSANPKFKTILDKFKIIGLTHDEKASIARNLVEKNPHLSKKD